ncbi:alanine--glyoxylate aminotransferase 2, mitochondrial [Patella vulgata]|uniref:alanine--glyoxylate aminotransferase 2, mitochondrial n=1 Tax=Patella vulgata TaxID=6465 RepID=UPI0021806AD6|nr:alanine--glyoxylate aminotransferase 2, mitochondrial [Patella vulgata]
MISRRIIIQNISKWQNKNKHCSSASYSSKREVPGKDYVADDYKGMSYEDTIKVRKTKLNPALLTYYKQPVMVHQGKMQYLFDTNGRRYIDLFAGIVTVSVGHCHPKVTAAATEQMKKLWHTTNIYLHPSIHEYASKLTDTLPGDLKVVYFTNSGSESNDLALHMARLYTGVFDTLSLRNAYHGASPYLMGLTALSTWRFNTPTGFGIHQVMNPDPYRGPWGGKYCRDSICQTDRDCDCKPDECISCDLYVDQLEDGLRFSMPKGRVGGFFAESIQGVGGTVQYPKGYLKKAYDAVHAKGGVCISDEVQTGFGRLGSHFWGFETHGVHPDIVTMAKGMGNGFPMGAVVTTPKIAEVMGTALHFNTFGGNPVACAVGMAVLEIIKEDNLQEHCAELGSYMLTELENMKSEFKCIGDVRGKGLMIGVEMVEDRSSRKPLPADKMADIWEETKDQGILLGKGGFYGNTFRIKPPMCLKKDDVDFSLEVLRSSIKKVMG